MSATRANPMLEAPGRPLPSRVGVVGAGTIGPDIAYYLASAIPGLEVVLVDIVETALDTARARIEAYVAKGLARNKLTADLAAAVESGLATTLDYGALAGCDWVIEAATENLELKRDIFARIEAIVAADCLVTSNTSSIPAERIFARLQHPGRATVTHFFAPAFRNPIVEVVAWDGVDPSTVDDLRWMFCATGKVPLVTADAVCFMLDRVFDNWCNEAGLLLARASAAEIDEVAREFVHAGPFFVLNLAQGNPIIVETNTLQMEEEGEHYRPAPVFRSVEGWKTLGPGDHVDVDAQTRAAVRDRLLGVLFSQSVDVVDRGIGGEADLELGCRLALGFKKGPFRLLADAGEDEASRILGRFSDERSGMPMPMQALAEYGQFSRYVLVDAVDDVRVLTIRRPEALNALDDDVTDELLAAIRAHEGDPDVAGFVITGYGPRAFCAGADIGRFPTMLGDAEAAAQYARDCSRLLVHLDDMDKPVVAALNGMALGGGLELALRCHGIVAVGDATLRFPETTLGIAPGIGALVVPYRRWPAAAAVFHRMIREGEELTAAEAERIGIVDALAPDHASLYEAAIDRVHELVGKVAAVPDGPVDVVAFEDVPQAVLDSGTLDPEVIALIEGAILKAAAAPSLTAALEVGYAAFGATACTEAARERITSFVSGSGKG